MTTVQELEEILAEIEARPRKLPSEPQISFEQMKPYWRDETALRQMYAFCESFGRQTRQADAASWCATAFRYGRLPGPDLRAELIKAALAGGWKRGYKHEWDKEEVACERAV